LAWTQIRSKHFYNIRLTNMENEDEITLR